MFDPKLCYVSLTADHGQFVAAEQGGGNQGEVEGGQPKGRAVANRDNVGGEGDWQTFALVPDPDGEPGVYGLRVTADGRDRYACCENEGKDGIIVFNREDLSAWQKFVVWAHEDGKMSFEAWCRRGFFMKAFPDGHVDLAQPEVEGKPVAEPGGYEKFLPVIISGSLGGSVGGANSSPLVGRMHCEGTMFCDDSGPRAYVVCHFMEAFSLFCRDEDTCVSQLQEIAKVYPAIRFCDTLGYYDYWDGREVNPHDFTAQGGYHVPATPDYWGKLIRFYRVLQDLKLKAHHSRGDLQMFGSRDRIKEHIGQVCRLIRDNGFQDCVELMEICNETVFNGVETPEDAQFLAQAVYQELPGTLVCHGAPGGTEEPDALRAWAAGADVGSVHGMRPGEFHDVLRHIFSCRREGFEEGTVIIQGEPFGPGDDVSGTRHDGDELGRSDDVEFLCAAALISTITGQRWCYMSGQGVRWNSDIQVQPGFVEVARAVAGVPNDVMGWTTTRGGSSNNPFKSPSGYFGDEGVSHGPARIDGAESGGRYAVLVNAGKAPYEIEACWDLEYEVVNPATMEVEQAGHLGAGERITLNYRIGRLVRSPFAAAGSFYMPPKQTPEPQPEPELPFEPLVPELPDRAWRPQPKGHIEVLGTTPPQRTRLTRDGRLIKDDRK